MQNQTNTKHFSNPEEKRNTKEDSSTITVSKVLSSKQNF